LRPLTPMLYYMDGVLVCLPKPRLRVTKFVILNFPFHC
jgi:hypothetical protein